MNKVMADKKAIMIFYAALSDLLWADSLLSGLSNCNHEFL